MFEVLHGSKCCVLKMCSSSLNPLKAQCFANMDSGSEYESRWQTVDFYFTLPLNKGFSLAT